MQLHHAELWYDGQVCDGNMPLLPFQSGCEAQIQTGRPYSNLPYPVAEQTCPYLFKRAVLPSVVRPSAPFLVFSNLTKGIPHASCRCNDSHDSVMYSHATQTSITVLSKFPRKTWGGVHARTVDTRHPSPILPSAWE